MLFTVFVYFPDVWLLMRGAIATELVQRPVAHWYSSWLSHEDRHNTYCICVKSLFLLACPPFYVRIQLIKIHEDSMPVVINVKLMEVSQFECYR